MSLLSVRRASLYGLVVLLLIGPLMAVVVLSWRLAHETVEVRLNTAAMDAVAEAESIVQAVLDDLRYVVAFPETNCSADVVDYLQQLTYRSPYITEIGIFDENMRFRCTSRGPADFGHSAEQLAGFPDEGAFLLVGDAASFNVRSVFLNLRGPGGAGVDALIHPESFRRPLTFGSDESLGGLTLSVVGEGFLTSSSGRPGRPPPDALVTEVTSESLHIVAEAWADSRVVMGSFWEQFRVFGPLALVCGGIAAFFASRQARRSTSMGAELRDAIRKGDLEVHYQPIMDIQDRLCIGAEALVRWRHPRRGLIRPDLFIGLAEETGLIVPLTRWLLKQIALEMVPIFREHQQFRVGINLSAAHFKDFEIVDEMERTFGRQGISLEHLVVEVTERQVIAENDRAPEVMNRLRAQGVRISLDDFGTGHNGLTYLRSLPLDSIKIDKGFVATIGGDALTRPVLDGILHLAARLNMKLVAEGVESPEQEEWLRERGVKLAQGFLFARPMTADALAVFLEDIEANAFGRVKPRKPRSVRRLEERVGI